MNNDVKINPLVFWSIIIVISLAFCVLYHQMVKTNEEAFYRGFNAGSEAQKMLDDLNNQKANKYQPKAIIYHYYLIEKDQADKFT